MESEKKLLLLDFDGPLCASGNALLLGLQRYIGQTLIPSSVDFSTIIYNATLQRKTRQHIAYRSENGMVLGLKQEFTGILGNAEQAGRYLQSVKNYELVEYTNEMLLPHVIDTVLYLKNQGREIKIVSNNSFSNIKRGLHGSSLEKVILDNDIYVTDTFGDKGFLMSSINEKYGTYNEILYIADELLDASSFFTTFMAEKTPGLQRTFIHTGYGYESSQNVLCGLNDIFELKFEFGSSIAGVLLLTVNSPQDLYTLISDKYIINEY